MFRYAPRRQVTSSPSLTHRRAPRRLAMPESHTVKVKSRNIVWPNRCAACNRPTPVPPECIGTVKFKTGDDSAFGAFITLGSFGLIASPDLYKEWRYPLCPRCVDAIGDPRRLKEDHDLEGAVGCLTILLAIWAIGVLIKGNLGWFTFLAACFLASLLILRLIERSERPRQEQWLAAGIWPNPEGGFVSCPDAYDSSGRSYSHASQQQYAEDLAAGRITWEFFFQNGGYAEEFRALNQSGKWRRMKGPMRG